MNHFKQIKERINFINAWKAFMTKEKEKYARELAFQAQYGSVIKLHSPN